MLRLKMRMFAAPTLSILCLCSLLTGVSASEPQLPATGAPKEEPAKTTLVSLDLRHASLAETIAALSHQYHLNVVADAFIDDVTPDVKFADVPLSSALPRIAIMYRREVHSVGGVVVFRHLRWFAAEGRQSFTPGFDTWKSPGSATVAFPQIAGSSAPPRLSVEASTAPLHLVLSKMLEATEYNVSVGGSRRDKRISASFHDAPPGQLIEAITYLLNARQQVFIDQSARAKEKEKELARRAEQYRNKRESASEALRNELVPLLTPAQRETIAAGKELAISLDTLPPSVRKDVDSYVNSQCDRIDRAGHDTPTSLDRTRLSEFSIVFMPPANAPGGALGVNGFFANGGRVNF